mmetsp:Transcript_25598/g.77034  ORF Transcript_25598/g.77034 Transcript_25598/m.77034 type:complete len:385 (+) Transcript_25598:569-1723(+)
MFLERLAQALPLLLVALHHVGWTTIIREVQIEVVHRRVHFAHSSQLRRLHGSRVLTSHRLCDQLLGPRMEPQDLEQRFLLRASLAATPGLLFGLGLDGPLLGLRTSGCRCGLGLVGRPARDGRHADAVLVQGAATLRRAERRPVRLGGGEGLPRCADSLAEGGLVGWPARRARGTGVRACRVRTSHRQGAAGHSACHGVAVPGGRGAAHARPRQRAGGGGVGATLEAQVIAVRRGRAIQRAAVGVQELRADREGRAGAGLALRGALQHRQVLEVLAPEDDEVVDLVGHRHLGACSTLRAETSNVLHGDGRLLAVQCVQDSLVPGVRGRYQADLASNVRDVARHGLPSNRTGPSHQAMSNGTPLFRRRSQPTQKRCHHHARRSST